MTSNINVCYLSRSQTRSQKLKVTSSFYVYQGAGGARGPGPGIRPVAGPRSWAEAAPARVAKDAEGCCMGGTKFSSSCGGGAPSSAGPRVWLATGEETGCFPISALPLPPTSAGVFLEAHLAHLCGHTCPSLSLRLHFPL